MRKALHLKDDKSDKFWCIETIGNEFAINFGKSGTIGRFQMKEFLSEAECTKEVTKLILQKAKKGYVEDQNFDFENRFYFDDQEYDLNSLTSHPHFRDHFVHELYYDCVDEETPFGSDTGNDALKTIEEVIRKKGHVDFESYPQMLMKEWGMDYIQINNRNDLDENLVKRLKETDEMNLIQSDMMTYSIAFAQIKITGFVNQQLKNRAILSIERLALVEGDSEIGEMMIKDLTSFDYVK